MNHPAPGETFDLLICGGTVIDGSGAPRFTADVGVIGDRILAVGDLTCRDAKARVNASDLVVAPGFIDAHTHDDRLVLSSPEMIPKVSQSEAAARLQPAGAIYFQMDEDDLQRIMSFADTMIGSDGLPHDACPHPRLWGTFPRVLGHYQRELGLLTLEEAVRRMTSVPARVFGLSDRGTVRAGAMADLVIFDPRSVIDTASFSDPKRPATGIERVIVNGADVWADGKATGGRPGEVLRRSST